jgi:hypothetical protein
VGVFGEIDCFLDFFDFVFDFDFVEEEDFAAIAVRFKWIPKRIVHRNRNPPK